MLPANRILIAPFDVRRSTCVVPRTLERRTPNPEPRTTNPEPRTTNPEPRTVDGWSPFGRLDELVDRFGIVERLADGETGAHPAVQLALRQQFFVPSLGGDPSAIEHENAVRVANRRQAVRDDDCRSAGAQTPQRAEDNLLGDRVERRGRFVEDENRSVLDDGARDAQPLALAPREAAAGFGDFGIVAIRQPRDELVGVRRPRRGLDLLVGRVQPAVA